MTTVGTPATPVLWHALAHDEVVRRTDSNVETGLSAAAAAERLSRLGPNLLRASEGESAFAILWRQLRSPLILVLVGAGALAIALGKEADGAVVLGVVALNTLIGFVQEWRAGRAIRALTKMISERARVRRDGVLTSVPAEALVPGDVVLLEAGEQVPADLRIVAARALKTTEAALTGESLPVSKDPLPVPEDAVLGDRRSMAYAGTLVTAGSGTGVVVATAGQTELGRISVLLDTADPGETPLVRALARVARLLTIAILTVAVLLAGVALARGYPAGDAVLAAITLAVAAIPEGLPAIVTIALAIGVRRMARRRAVVRNLPAVETLGGVTIICSDKTGTLTRNEMTVQAIWSPVEGDWVVEGVGYTPHGALRPAEPPAPTIAADDPVVPESIFALLLAGILCADARLVPAGATDDDDEPGRRSTDDSLGADAWRADGDPTEVALIVAARKGGLEEDTIRLEWPRIDAIPFDSARQWMATLHHRVGEDDRVAYVKGAPERVLALCSSDSSGAPLDRDAVAMHASRLARRGLRVLALAERRGLAELDEATLPADFVLLGLAGMIDPPRQEAIEAVAMCGEAGIAVAMITGDHRDTAIAVALQLALPGVGREPLAAAEALTGAELATLDDDALRSAVRSHRIFARVSPEQKLRLVRALQAEGHVVSMTGDGVNDAPALRQADIGVAMGITGTAVSREAADVVLTDDDFATIAAAVAEGRRVYDNLVKALAFVLPTNLGEALVILVAVLAFPIVDGTPLLPMAPVQILWINLVATVTLALPLAFEAREPDVMRRPPRAVGAPLLGRFIMWRTAAVALLMAGVALALFLWEYDRMRALGDVGELALREAQTLVVTAVVLMQMVYVVQCRSLTGSARDVGLWRNPWVYIGIGALLVLQLAFVYLPPLQRAFGSAAIDAAAWLRAAVAALIVIPLVAAEKRWRRRSAGRKRDPEKQENQGVRVTEPNSP